MKKLSVFCLGCLSLLFFACSGEREYINYHGLSMGMSAKAMVDSLQQRGLALDTTKYEDRYVLADTLMNNLKVAVTNLWTNRLIGDAQTPDAYDYGRGGNMSVLPDWYIGNRPKPQDGKVSFSVVKLFNASDPLYDSGLVGPVVIRAAMAK